MGKSSAGFAMLSGIVLGGLMGAAAGLLLAPHPGDKTRKVLRKKLDELAKEGNKALQNVDREKLEPMVNEVRDLAQTKANVVGKSIKTAVKSIQQELKDTPAD